MKFFSRRGFVVGTLLLLSISEINGAHVRRRKRRANSSGKKAIDWQAILDDVNNIPVIGNGFYTGLKDMDRTVHKLDELTNGAVSRIASGYPPCTVDINEIRCNGKPKDGSIIDITIELINGTALPSLAKQMLIHFFNTAVFPMIDVIFGIPVKSGQKIS